ncbi:aspartate/glutamate racemase family protein [Microvirga alba]|uniref:aspartate/glutamate racemase family protein n=1 Tax=Microvirga alba TaxID=2791025 RepID=UPI001E459152|nr:aspartate/glutamate racemase family protein [Microvirga alba]
MTDTIHVINPNSSAHVTQAIALAAAPFQAAGRDVICVSMSDGPKGIETETDLQDSVPPMLRYALEKETEAAAFVVACFSDPGLFLLRERLRRPVFGIAECGALAAMLLGRRLGVISILQAAVPRHLRYFAAMGIGERLAGDRAIGLGVAELKDREAMFARMVETGQILKRQDGADVILMGGAAMSGIRASLEHELGIPVVDPTQAAIAMADGFTKLNRPGNIK